MSDVSVVDDLLSADVADQSPGQNISVVDSLLGIASSVAGSVIETVKELPSDIYELATGEGRTEFPEMGELGTSGPEVPAFSSEGMRILGGYLSTTDPEAIADIVVKALPNARRRNDKFGNPIISYKGEDYYINKPGFSEADAFQLMGFIAEFMPAAKFGAQGAGLLKRMARTGPAMALTSAGLDVAAGELGSEQGVDYGKALIIGGAGMAAEVLAPAAAKLWRAIKGNPKFVDPATGELTGQGKRAADAAGVSPDDLKAYMGESDVRAAEVAQELITPTQRGAAGAQRMHAEGREFGVEHTAGQAEYYGSEAAGRGLVTEKIVMEEGMRRGRFGSGAGETVRAKDAAQAEQISAAEQRIQKGLAGGEEVTATTAPEMGNVVSPGLQSRAAAQEARVAGAYKAAGEMDMRFTGTGMSDLFQGVRQGLREAGVVIEGARETTKLFPATRRAFMHIAKLNKEMAKRKKAPTITMQSLKHLETVRKRIGADIGAAKTRADKRGATLVKKYFDKWLDDAVDNGLFTGDMDALDLLKIARGERRIYARLYEDPSAAGKVITKIIDEGEDIAGEQTINWIFGRIGLGSKETATKVVRGLKDIFGEESAEWYALRQAGWIRMMRNREGKLVTPRVFNSTVNKLMNEAPALMGELYSKAEIATMRRYAAVIRRTMTPEELVNKSTVTDSLLNWFQKIGQRFEFRAAIAGDPVSAAGIGAAARAPGYLRSARARQMMKPRSEKPSAPGVTAVVGGVAADSN